MSEPTAFASRPWIPNEEKRAKYEESGEKEACGTNPLVGVFTAHGTRKKYLSEDLYNVVTLTTASEGDVDVHCQPTVLSNQMLGAKPAYGETVTVFYEGERVSGSGQGYASYRVKVDREVGGQPDWAGAPEAAPTPAAPAPAPTPEPAAPERTGPLGPEEEFPF